MGVYKKGKSWYINFYYQGQRIQECVGQASKTVAKEVEAKRKAEVIEGRYDLNKVKLTPLFETFLDQYLEIYSKQNKRPRSYLRDITSSKPLKEYFKGKRLADITAWHIEKYKPLRREDVSPATVNRELALLRHMLNIAVEWGKLKESPFKGVKLFKENNGRMRILSPEQEIILFEAIRANPNTPYLEDIVITALNSGMRRSEILTLKKDMLNFKEGYILVEETKSGEARKIPMNERLTKTLKKTMDKNLKSPYVFCKDDGSPFGNIRKGFDKAVKKTRLDGLRFHDLRHTFASRLVMAGVDIITVQQLLGHKTLRMTMRYSHPTPEHKKAAVKILDGVTTILTTRPEMKILEFPGKA